MKILTVVGIRPQFVQTAAHDGDLQKEACFLERNSLLCMNKFIVNKLLKH